MSETIDVGPDGVDYAAAAHRTLQEVTVPGGRADFTNPQKIALAQVYATLELARQQRVANYMTAISGSAAAVEHDGSKGSTDATVRRIAWRNRLRTAVRAALRL